MEQSIVIAEGLLPSLNRSRALLESDGLRSKLVRPPGCDPRS